MSGSIVAKASCANATPNVLLTEPRDKVTCGSVIPVGATANANIAGFPTLVVVAK